MDGRTVELVPGGASIDVTWSNREEFLQHLEKYRINESKLQCAAIRAGLATQIPLRIMTLFHWTELERMVCGNPEVDIDLLRRATDYEGHSESSETVQHFWNVCFYIRDITRNGQ